MTGLSLADDALVEIGVLVTDSELNILGDGVDVVIKASDEQMAQMSDFVRKMHTDSGLIAEIPQGKSLLEAEEIVLGYLNQHCLPGKSPLPLSNDRCFLYQGACQALVSQVLQFRARKDRQPPCAR